MNLIRRLKISKVIPIHFTEDEDHLISYVKYWLSDLVISVDDENSLVYYAKYNNINNLGRVAFKHNIKYDTLLINYKDLIEPFNGVLLINETRILMKYLIEQKTKKKYSKALIFGADKW